MEKIYFDSDTFIWKGKLNLSHCKDDLLKESYDVINNDIDNTTGAYSYKLIWNDSLDFVGDVVVVNQLDSILQIGINKCKDLAELDGIQYNKINTDSWINVVLSKNPLQINFKHNEMSGVDKYHTHTDINEMANAFYPHYTFVYYIQMPDVMDGEDGVLYFKSKDGIEYWVRPEEDDLIIMPADVPHSPNNAPNSTIDRVVLAGNVGFDLIKTLKTII